MTELCLVRRMELVEGQVLCRRCCKVLTEAESDSHRTECRNAWRERRDRLEKQSRVQRYIKESISCWHCQRAFDVSPTPDETRESCPYCRRSDLLPIAPDHFDGRPLSKLDYDLCRFCNYFLPLHSFHRHFQRVYLGNDVIWVRPFVRSSGSVVKGHYRRH